MPTFREHSDLLADAIARAETLRERHDSLTADLRDRFGDPAESSDHKIICRADLSPVEVVEVDRLAASATAASDQCRAALDDVTAHRRALDRLRRQGDEQRTQIAEVARIISSGDSMPNVDYEHGDGARADDRRKSVNVNRYGSAPWATADGPIRTMTTAAEVRSRALSAIDATSDAPDVGRTRITALIERGHDVGQDADLAARWALATSDPAYYSAFCKVAQDPQRGFMFWTDDERRAARRAEEVRLDRAMSLSDAAGGYLVPFQLDPTVILTSDGSTNPFRQIARQVVATGDVWNGVSSAGASASYDAEAAEVSDDSPTLAQPSVTVRTGRVFVPISLEAAADMANGAQEIARILADALDQLESAAFTDGQAASNEPVGIVTALAAAGAPSVVAAAGETISANDVYAVQESLGARWQPRAEWLLNRASINTVRRLHNPSGTEPPLLENGRLLDRPYHEASFLPTPDPTVTDVTYPLIYGSWDQFVIAERIGLTVELVPHLFGVNRRPTGQRGWFGYARHGSNVTAANAFRALEVTTTL